MCSVSMNTKSMPACLASGGHRGEGEIIAEEKTWRPSCSAAMISRPFIRGSLGQSMEQKEAKVAKKVEISRRYLLPLLPLLTSVHFVPCYKISKLRHVTPPSAFAN